MDIVHCKAIVWWSLKQITAVGSVCKNAPVQIQRVTKIGFPNTYLVDRAKELLKMCSN